MQPSQCSGQVICSCIKQLMKLWENCAKAKLIGFVCIFPQKTIWCVTFFFKCRNSDDWLFLICTIPSDKLRSSGMIRINFNHSHIDRCVCVMQSKCDGCTTDRNQCKTQTRIGRIWSGEKWKWDLSYLLICRHIAMPCAYLHR